MGAKRRWGQLHSLTDPSVLLFFVFFSYSPSRGPQPDPYSFRRRRRPLSLPSAPFAFPRCGFSSPRALAMPTSDNRFAARIAPARPLFFHSRRFVQFVALFLPSPAPAPLSSFAPIHAIRGSLPSFARSGPSFLIRADSRNSWLSFFLHPLRPSKNGFAPRYAPFS